MTHRQQINAAAEAIAKADGWSVAEGIDFVGMRETPTDQLPLYAYKTHDARSLRFLALAEAAFAAITGDRPDYADTHTPLFPMKFEDEEMIKKHVAAFVATLNGRFRDHCSDAMLTEVLMLRFCCEPYRGEHAIRALATLAEDPNAAYDAACPIFERALEHGCRAGGNGHHVAQAFGAFMEAALANNQGEPQA